MDLSSRTAALTEEVERLKLQSSELAESEKAAVLQAANAQRELNLAIRSNEDIQQKIAEEMNSLKKELHEKKNKMKAVQDSRQQTDMQAMSLRLEVTRYENEVKRMTDWCKDMELKLQDSNAQAKLAKEGEAAMTQEFRKSKVRIGELEETLNKKNSFLDKLKSDLSRLEREGIADVKRLRLQVVTCEDEITELKDTIFNLKKEVSESKINYTKLQQSTAGHI